MASEIFQTEINSIFDKFFEAPEPPKPKETKATTPGGDTDSQSAKSEDEDEFKSAVMMDGSQDEETPGSLDDSTKNQDYEDEGEKSASKEIEIDIESGNEPKDDHLEETKKEEPAADN